MRIRQITAGAALAGALLFGVSSTASADPVGSKNSFSFPTMCNGQTFQFVVNSANGQGAGAQNNNTAPFAPAHAIGSNLVFHPTQFDLTFSFTSSGGQTQSFVDTNTKNNPKTPVTCTIHYSQTDAQGNTFALNGTVSGFFT
jgi:hypothetical protein